MEAVRKTDHPCSVVIVTTDKCYENREWLHAYREEDAMGGYDPYSASKGCAELSFLHIGDPSLLEGRTKVASARAGNVIGGGDWALDRIVPDVFRALQRKRLFPFVTSLQPPLAARFGTSFWVSLASSQFVWQYKCGTRQ